MIKKNKICIIHSNNLFRCGLKLLLNEVKYDVNCLDTYNNEYCDIMFVECTTVNDCKYKISNIKKQLPHCKIIIFSDILQYEDIKNLLESGINGILTHDISEEFLVNMLDFIDTNGFVLSGTIHNLFSNPNILPVSAQKVSRSQFRNTHSNLTAREYEVLKLVVDGKSNAQIAQDLTISEHTAKAHVCNIIQKLVVDDRTQAAVKAIKDGIV